MPFAYNRLDRPTDRQIDGRNYAVIRSLFTRFFHKERQTFSIRAFCSALSGFLL